MNLKRPLIPLLFLFASAAWPSSIPDYPFVFAQGTAVLKIAPNIVTCRLTIRAINVDPKHAQGIVNARLTELLAVLSKNRLLKDDVDASAVRKAIVTNDYSRADPVQVRGYNVSRGVTFKVRDLGRWPAIADYLLGAKNIDNLTVEYDRIDRAALEADLITKAAADAKNRATHLAVSFGRRLGPPAAISPQPFASIGDTFGLGHSYGSQYAEARQFTIAVAANGDTFLVPPTISISASVNALFKLE